MPTIRFPARVSLVAGNGRQAEVSMLLSADESAAVSDAWKLDNRALWNLPATVDTGRVVDIARGCFAEEMRTMLDHSIEFLYRHGIPEFLAERAHAWALLRDRRLTPDEQAVKDAALAEAKAELADEKRRAEESARGRRRMASWHRKTTFTREQKAARVRQRARVTSRDTAARRRAVKADIPSVRFDRTAYYGLPCYSCGAEADTHDHWYPLQGERTEFTVDAPWNCLPQCRPCGSSKNNADPLTWWSRDRRPFDGLVIVADDADWLDSEPDWAHVAAGL